MKKVFLTALLSVFVLSAFAQKKVLKNANKEFRKENYAEAQALAMEASKHPETQDEPEIYIMLGKIKLNDFMTSGKSDFSAAEAAYEYFVTAMEKGDDDLKEDMMAPAVFTQLPGQDEPVQTGGSETMGLLMNMMISDGGVALDQENNEAAAKMFALAAKIMPSDELSFFAGYSADLAEDKEGMMKHYGDVINSTADSLYENANFAYNGVIQYQLQQEAYDEALENIRKAQTAFPEVELYKKWEMEVLIQNDMLDEAVEGLKKTVAAGGADVQTYTQLAFLHWQAENYDDAISVATQAVEKDGSYFDANYVLGGALYDVAASTLRKAGDPSVDDATYAKLKEDAKQQFEKARPYFEKCLALKPDDSALYAPLSTIYDALGMDAKRDEMLDKMGN